MPTARSSLPPNKRVVPPFEEQGPALLREGHHVAREGRRHIEATPIDKQGVDAAEVRLELRGQARLVEGFIVQKAGQGDGLLARAGEHRKGGAFASGHCGEALLRVRSLLVGWLVRLPYVGM